MHHIVRSYNAFFGHALKMHLKGIDFFAWVAVRLLERNSAIHTFRSYNDPPDN